MSQDTKFTQDWAQNSLYTTNSKLSTQKQPQWRWGPYSDRVLLTLIQPNRQISSPILIVNFMLNFILVSFRMHQPWQGGQKMDLCSLLGIKWWESEKGSMSMTLYFLKIILAGWFSPSLIKNNFNIWSLIWILTQRWITGWGQKVMLQVVDTSQKSIILGLFIWDKVMHLEALLDPPPLRMVSQNWPVSIPCLAPHWKEWEGNAYQMDMGSCLASSKSKWITEQSVLKSGLSIPH